MIVCICKAVSDRHIRSAVQGGTTCVKELSRRTGLGTCCGKCLPEARATIAGCLQDGGATRYFATATATAAAATAAA